MLRRGIWSQGLRPSLNSARPNYVSRQQGLARIVLMNTNQQSTRRSFIGMNQIMDAFNNAKTKVIDTFSNNTEVTKALPETSVSKSAEVVGTKSKPANTATTPRIPKKKRPKMKFETGRVARLASGSVLARWGDTVVLTTAVSEPQEPSASSDFMPLSVEYREKFYSTGSIPGSRLRREMGTTDEEVLRSRAIDRALRPLFPPSYLNTTQVVSTVHSFDNENDPFVLAINGASASLALSDIPWDGPVAAVRVGYVNNKFITNPTTEQMKSSSLDLLYAAKKNGQTVMIEASGDEIPESIMKGALSKASVVANSIIDDIIALQKSHGKSKQKSSSTSTNALVTPERIAKAQECFSLGIKEKLSRQKAEGAAAASLRKELRSEFPTTPSAEIESSLHEILERGIRSAILTSKGEFGKRFDGRNQHEIRKLDIETGVIPSSHGSSIFARGDTQALCTVTLGSLAADALPVESATTGRGTKHATLQYEFPPYSVNETGRIGGVNRRMIGHGALAEKAIQPVLPSSSAYPYFIRMTSETTMSDGSSSMAATCGATLALLDAGVPIKRPVAGISVGCVAAKKEAVTEGGYTLLTDILGTEDHFGDMDFKIAGTSKGITGIQLDVKVPGMPLEVLVEGLGAAKTGRLEILNQMNNVTRKTIKEAAKKKNLPEYLTMQVAARKLSEVVGRGGSNRRRIEAETGTTITIDEFSSNNSDDSFYENDTKDDDEDEIAIVGIFGKNKQDVEKAQSMVLSHSFSLSKGEIYNFEVMDVLDMGAYVQGPYGTKAFLHISQIQKNSRVEDITKFIALGDKFDGICIDDRQYRETISLAKLPSSYSPLVEKEASETSSSVIKQVVEKPLKQIMEEKMSSSSSSSSRGGGKVSELSSVQMAEAEKLKSCSAYHGQTVDVTVKSVKNSGVFVTGPWGETYAHIPRSYLMNADTFKHDIKEGDKLNVLCCYTRTARFESGNPDVALTSTRPVCSTLHLGESNEVALDSNTMTRVMLSKKRGPIIHMEKMYNVMILANSANNSATVYGTDEEKRKECVAVLESCADIYNGNNTSEAEVLSVNRRLVTFRIGALQEVAFHPTSMTFDAATSEYPIGKKIKVKFSKAGRRGRPQFEVVKEVPASM